MSSEVLIPQVTLTDRDSGSSTAVGNDIAISVRNVGKMYSLYNHPQDRLKQAFLWGRRKLYREFWALRDVSLEVRRGEALGIIGRNGAGKSTLLQILAGTLSPTTGEVRINGRVAALLELGSGFNPRFTGRENVYLSGAILSFSREEMDELFDEIAAFADIGEFIDQPVKLYSSGMFVRLAFAVQVCLEPDVLIVDEVLSVGDIFFQQKCHARMEELITRHTAVIIVSHNMRAIEKYSTQAMLLDKGRCLFLGQPNEAVTRYYYLSRSAKTYGSLLKNISENSSKNTVTTSRNTNNRSLKDWPPVEYYLDLSSATVIGEPNVARCTAVAVCNLEGQPCRTFEIGETAVFYYEFEILQDILVPIGGVTIITSKNIPIHGRNSLQHRVKAPATVSRGSRVRLRQTIKLDLVAGEYTFNVGLGTINAYYYERAELLNYSEMRENYLKVISITNAGSFDIIPKKEGQPHPFYGYVGLEGECVLDLLQA